MKIQIVKKNTKREEKQQSVKKTRKLDWTQQEEDVLIEIENLKDKCDTNHHMYVNGWGNGIDQVLELLEDKLRKKKKDQQETKRWITNCTTRCKIVYRYITGK